MSRRSLGSDFLAGMDCSTRERLSAYIVNIVYQEEGSTNLYAPAGYKGVIAPAESALKQERHLPGLVIEETQEQGP